MADGGYQLRYDGRSLRVIGAGGQIVASYAATSGRPGSTLRDVAVKNQGPLPPGTYSLNPRQFSEGGWLRNLRGDWGQWRVPLTPSNATNTYNRSGFFIHGGRFPGSAGCIDVDGHDTDLHELLKDQQGPIALTVDYSGRAADESFAAGQPTAGGEDLLSRIRDLVGGAGGAVEDALQAIRSLVSDPFGGHNSAFVPEDHPSLSVEANPDASSPAAEEPPAAIAAPLSPLADEQALAPADEEPPAAIAAPAPPPAVDEPPTVDEAPPAPPAIEEPPPVVDEAPAPPPVVEEPPPVVEEPPPVVEEPPPPVIDEPPVIEEPPPPPPAIEAPI